MNPGYELKTSYDDIKKPEQEELKNPLIQSSNNKSFPKIAGILLIIAGILALVYWIQFLLLDITILESYIDIDQLQQLDPTITIEQIVEILNTCAVIGCVLSIFPILGGILAIKKKLWGISLVGSIIGLFTLGIIFTSSILSLISLILLIISKKEFQNKPI
ncbi:hypothetical protein AYK20_08005 [Thermoplasmatales archaeon SG8-52-1]|nr:MAG: hypothetical protein AYK20_08005 [Thermoplasmatales archaeon SG8-52-1]